MFICRESMASAVLLAVKAPEARRTESMLGRRFFIGEVAGVEKEVEGLVADCFGWCWRAERGEGVRLVDCCREEMRADLRGEKGSHESP